MNGTAATTTTITEKIITINYFQHCCTVQSKRREAAHTATTGWKWINILYKINVVINFGKIRNIGHDTIQGRCYFTVEQFDRDTIGRFQFSNEDIREILEMYHCFNLQLDASRKAGEFCAFTFSFHHTWDRGGRSGWYQKLTAWGNLGNVHLKCE